MMARNRRVAIIDICLRCLLHDREKPGRWYDSIDPVGMLHVTVDIHTLRSCCTNVQISYAKIGIEYK